jgi:hypothetical protein
MLIYATWVVVRETLRGNGAAVGPFLRGVATGWRHQDNE